MTLTAVDVHRLGAERVRDFEMEEARDLQREMVPVEPLHAHPVEVASYFRPHSAIGGDFLDYFLLPDHTVGLYVGDVVGKGLPAALYAALAVGTLRGISKTGEPPAGVLELLNRRLRMRCVRGRHCAVQYAVFYPETQVLCCVNAGLPGPLHLTAWGCREFQFGGFPSGLFDEARYEPLQVKLDPGDSVLFFTDGLTEAFNSCGEQFGMEELIRVCELHRHASAEALLLHVFAAVDQFAGGHPQHDDMAAALLKINA